MKRILLSVLLLAASFAAHAQFSPNTVLTAGAAFTSSASYVCTANDTSAVQAVQITQSSGTSVTFTVAGMPTNHTVQYRCTGN